MLFLLFTRFESLYRKLKILRRIMLMTTQDKQKIISEKLRHIHQGIWQPRRRKIYKELTYALSNNK